MLITLPCMFRLDRGANLQTDGSIEFAVWAPAVKQVSVEDAHSGSEVLLLDAAGGGVHRGVLAPDRAISDYYYRLDRDTKRSDPVSRLLPEGVFGPTRLVDPNSFQWSDDGWRGVPLGELVVYEVHIGTASAAGDFSGLIALLPYLKELGITALELMPVAQFPGRRNWGYDGINAYAVQNTYGGPEGLRKLVDAAHADKISVLLDVVYNHMGPEGNFLADFGPYFTERHHTPWGSAINFDDAECDEVRRYFIDNALYWLSEYHLDGLRLDAVHAIYDFGALHILEELKLHTAALEKETGRRAHIIAESDLNDPRIIRGREKGGYGLDAQWNDDFHHAVVSRIARREGGYFRDYTGPQCIKKALAENFVLAGDYSSYRRRRHGASAADLPPSKFVAFIQNHDQVGNPSQGERLFAAVGLRQHCLATSLLLLSPFVPLIFMGEEYGEDNPFFYFVDHNSEELLRAVREGRRREFQGFEWQGQFADPGAEETFLRSKPHFEKRFEGRHAQLYALYRDLISLRRSSACFSSPERRIEVLDTKPPELLHTRLSSADDKLEMFFNLSDEAVELPAAARNSELLFSSAEYCDDGRSRPQEADAREILQTLSGFAAVCLRERR